MQPLATITQNDLDLFYKDLGTLRNDKLFAITSNKDLLYNCIAWAMGTNQMWVGTYRNVPWIWWPSTCSLDQSPQSLVDAFTFVGFEICDNNLYEDDYDKVILYELNGKWTHAARVLSNDVCYSKFGESWDGHHSNKDDLFDGTIYGHAYTYMRRLKVDAHKTTDVIPQRISPVVNRDAWSRHLERIRANNKAKAIRVAFCGHNNSRAIIY